MASPSLFTASALHRAEGLRCLAVRDPWRAVGHFSAALRERPADPELLALLGDARDLLGDAAAAADCFRRSLDLAETPAVEVRWAAALARAGDPRGALRAFHAVLRRRPDDAAALGQLAIVLTNLGWMRLARRLAERAAELAPGSASAQGNLGIVLYRAHRLERAAERFERALALDPTCDLARYHLGLVHLTRGDYRRGFAASDASLRIWQPGLPAERWRGEPLDGRTIVLYGHNGLGDTLQFVRYVPRVQARGGRVILVVQERLRTLLQGFPGTAAVVGAQDPIPPHDTLASLLELPAIFADTLADVPARTPYLRADRRRTALWGERLAAHPGLKVGIAWQGNPQQQDGLYRSCRLRDFAPLAGIGGVRFHSLQVGPGARQLADAPAGLEVEALEGLDVEAGPFVDTAALMGALDLVITVDTSICHLAGALGRPTWLLLPYWADWRWMLDTRRSPWYPSFRLFRQPRPFDWASVFTAVRAALGELVRASRPTADHHLAPRRAEPTERTLTL